MKKTFLPAIAPLMVILPLFACGSGGNSGNSGQIFVGGNVLGTPLLLSGVVSTIAGDGNRGATDCTVGTSANFDFSKGITTDGTHLYVADSSNHLIRKVVIATGAVSTIAGDNVTTPPGPGYADGTGSAARFAFPGGVTTDRTNVYVTDTNNHLIRKVVIATGVVSTVAGDNVTTPPVPGYADGTGSAAKFSYPNGITTDGINLYVADGNNHLIRKVVIATGAVSTIAGDNVTTPPEPGYSDGTGPAASFAYPTGITTDGSCLYVADTDNHLIRKVVIATGVVTTVAGDNNNIPPYGGPPPPLSNGTGSSATFASPDGVATDGTNLYVSDTRNNVIRKVVIATGVVTTIAGDNNVMGFAEGTGVQANFARPFGIATDGKSLFISDTRNYRIRKIR